MREVELGEIAEVFGGYAFKSKDFNETSGVPVIKISNIQDGEVSEKTLKEYLPENYLDDYENYQIRRGDILVALSGATTGKTGVYNIDSKSLLNQRVGLVRAKYGQAEQKYLSYYVSKITDDILNKAQGVAQPNISTKELAKFEIPLPSLSEQKAIVAKLDWAQRLIDIDKEMLAKYDELIQSVFLEMFGDPVTNSKGWEVKKLGDLTTKVGSGSTPRGGSKVYQDYGNIFIRSQNVLMNKLDLEDVAFISDEIHEGMKNTWVQENDVLLNITGASIGRVCVYNKSEAANVNQHVCILRPIQDEIKPYYLSHLISSKNYQDKILGQQTGGTRQAFNMTQIKNFDIPLPPLELQTQFNEMLTKLKGEIQSLKVNSKKSEELFSSLVQGAFG